MPSGRQYEKGRREAMRRAVFFSNTERQSQFMYQENFT